MNKKILVGVDPGDKKSGIVILEDGQIKEGDHIPNEEVMRMVELSDNPNELTFVFETIKPYKGWITQTTLDTCEFIGALRRALQINRITHMGISRNEVKDFVFKQHTDLIREDIVKRLILKKKYKKDGELYTPSFLYVHDRIVTKAMRARWGIPIPKPGKRSLYGLSDHSFQALAVASVYIWREERDAGGFLRSV